MKRIEIKREEFNERSDEKRIEYASCTDRALTVRPAANGLS